MKMEMGTHEIRNITIRPEILKLIAEFDEFKGRWKVMETPAPEKADEPEADGLFWPIFLLLGWEQVRIAPGITRVNPPSLTCRASRPNISP